MNSFNPKSYFVHVNEKYFPNFIFGDKNLSATCMTLYAYLYTNCNEKGGMTVTYSELSGKMNCSERSVQSQINELISLNYIIKVSNGFKKANTYILQINQRILEYVSEKKLHIMQEVLSSKICQAPVSNFCQQLKSIKNIKPPLSPTKANCASDKKTLVGCVSDWQKNWEVLWQSYPVKNDESIAKKIFFSMCKKGILPHIEKLLSIIDKYISTDSRWKNGYIPYLKNFLRFQKWTEEPLVREEKQGDFIMKKSNYNSNEKKEVLKPEEGEKIMKLQQNYIAVQESYIKPAYKPLPELLQGKVIALQLYFAKLRNTEPEPLGLLKSLVASSDDPENLIKECQYYTLRQACHEQSLEMPLSDWLKLNREKYGQKKNAKIFRQNSIPCLS